MSRWPLIRDLILFAFGLAGAVWETVVHPPPDSSALVFFGTCIGLPAFLPDGITIGRRDRDEKDDVKK